MDGGDSLRRWALAAAIISFELTRWLVLLVLHPVNSPLRTTYFAVAHGWIDRGVDPYARGWSKPPCALWMVAAPRVVDYRTQVTQPPRRIIWRYEALFRRMLLAVDVAALIAFLLAVGQLRRAPLALAAWCYVALTAPLGHVLYDRSELGLTLLVAASAWCWARGLRDARGSYWLAASAFALGLAAATSDEAILMLPALLAAAAPGVRIADATRVPSGLLLAAGLSGWALPYALQAALTGPDVFRALLLGAGRGVEVESIPATLAYVARGLGMSLGSQRIEELHFLRHAGESWLTLLSVALLAVVVVVVARGAWRGQPARGPAYADSFEPGLDPWCWAALGGLALAWFGPELPPERFVWTLPLALWLGLARCDSRRLLWFLCLLGAISLSTTLVFPCTFYQRPPDPRAAVFIGRGLIPNFDTLPLALLLLRNALVVVLWSWCWRLVRRG